MRMPIDTILQFDSNEVTDHNRSELSVSTEKLMNEQRMVDGTLRRYIVAEKRTWSVSWEDLFSEDIGMVDEAWGGKSIYDFYQRTPGEFQLTLTNGQGEVERVIVMFSDFSHTIKKRSQHENGDLWDIDIEMVEV